jgi:hypothetical protein
MAATPAFRSGGDAEKGPEDGLAPDHDGSSCSSHDDDLDVIGSARPQNNRAPLNKVPTRPSQEVRRTASNVMAHVTSRLTTRSLPEPPPPPDGGLGAWTQVLMGWLVLFTTWGYVNSFGSFQTYYTATMPLPPSTISWIGSVQIWLSLSIGVFSGRLLDAGLFRPTFLVGAVIQVLGMFLMSISTTYWQLMLTQGVLTGIGSGIFFTPSIGLVATYFKERRALAIGLATTGNSAGGIVYPLVVRQLIPVIGFAWTTRVLAFSEHLFGSVKVLRFCYTQHSLRLLISCSASGLDSRNHHIFHIRVANHR